MELPEIKELFLIKFGLSPYINKCKIWRQKIAAVI